MFQFSCRLAFYQVFVFKPDTENFDAVSSKCANFAVVQLLKVKTYT